MDSLLNVGEYDSFSSYGGDICTFSSNIPGNYVSVRHLTKIALFVDAVTSAS